MGLVDPHVKGREQKFFAVEEATFGTLVKPTGTDAMRILSSTFSFSQERKNREDARPTRSMRERITGKKEVSWSMESFLLGVGASFPVDIDPLLKNSLGVATSGPPDVYTLADAQGSLKSLTLLREFDGNVMEAVTGAWVEEVKISIAGGDEPKISFSGGAQDHIHTGTAKVKTGATGTVIDLDDVLPEPPDPDKNFQIGSIVDIGSNLNLKVDAVDSTAKTITVESSITTTTGDAIIPTSITETVGGSPLAGINGDFQIDTLVVPITAFEVTLANGIKPVDDEAFQDSAQDFILGFRAVTGSLTVRATKAEMIRLGRRKGFATQSLKVLAGEGTIASPTTKLSVLIEIPQAEFEFSELEVPQSEEGTFSLPFTALASSDTAKDELKLTWT